MSSEQRMTSKESENSGKKPNIIDDTRDTYFIDLDGTLVWHNYYPEEDVDIPLKGSVEFLNSLDDSEIVFCTSRTLEHANLAINSLKRAGFSPKRHFRILPNLPTGKRILLNDYKDPLELKAIAINFLRNTGINNV